MNKRVISRADLSPSSLSSGIGDVPFRSRIFLLSPANASGIKGQRLLSGTAQSEFAQRLTSSGVPLGEVYRFISSLYFRGKLDYAERFQNPPQGVRACTLLPGLD